MDLAKGPRYGRSLFSEVLFQIVSFNEPVLYHEVVKELHPDVYRLTVVFVTEAVVCSAEIMQFCGKAVLDPEFVKVVSSRRGGIDVEFGSEDEKRCGVLRRFRCLGATVDGNDEVRFALFVVVESYRQGDCTAGGETDDASAACSLM